MRTLGSYTMLHKASPYAKGIREQELALDVLREQAEMGNYAYTRCEW
jgi:hypothetical protein